MHPTTADTTTAIKYRDEQGRLIRGNIRSVFIDSDKSAYLYDEDGNDVSWPDDWPSVIFPKSFRQLGIEVAT